MKTGIDSIPDGGFAPECPACPHPGHNLPDNWEQAPEDKKCTCRTSLLSHLTSSTFPRWLYALFLAIDANFRMKLKRRNICDPEMGSGWSYFVKNLKYNKHVSQKTVEREVSSLQTLSWLTGSRVPGC